MIRRGLGTGRYLPATSRDAAPLLHSDPRNPAAVSLGRLGGRAAAANRRARVIATMEVLRGELGLGEWRA